MTLIFPDIPMFDPDTVKSLMRSAVTVVIWVPYMLMSERVRLTFVEKRPLRLTDSAISPDPA